MQDNFLPQQSKALSSTCSLWHLVCCLTCSHLSHLWKLLFPLTAAWSAPQSACSFMTRTDQTWGFIGLTIKLVGSALCVRGLRRQEQGLVVQIALWGGHFVVRSEFCRAHVAAQGEQRLAQLPCNHWILEGAGSPGRKQGGEKKRRKKKSTWLDVLQRFTLSDSLCTSLLTLSLPSFSFLLLTHHSPSLYCSLPPQLPSFIWAWCYPADTAGCCLVKNCYGSRGFTIIPCSPKKVIHPSPRGSSLLTCSSSSANTKLTATYNEIHGQMNDVIQILHLKEIYEQK